MGTLNFVKYTSCGNNFVIVDALDGLRLSEVELGRFAFQATNQYFGIGADNLLVIQRCSGQLLDDINQARGYWEHPPAADTAELVFRMFEPSGEEAYCCGNGLMCIANYLHHAHGITHTTILTEVPLRYPCARHIGIEPVEGRSWADLGEPRRAPAGLVDTAVAKPLGLAMDLLEDLDVRFREHDLAPFSEAAGLRLKGHLVFTGEPHLVVFPEQDFADPELAGSIFSATVPHVTDTSGVCKRHNFGTFLLRRIGYDLNRHHPTLFPHGVNVNLVRVDPDTGAIEYRCFERGINRETLACGTGALAVAYVASALELLGGDELTVLPHRCRWYEPHTTITVRTPRDGSGWVLLTAPRALCHGSFVDWNGEEASTGAATPAAQEAVASELDSADALRLAS